MRTLSLVILMFIYCGNSLGQTNEFKTIGFYCGYAGTETPTVQKFSSLYLKGEIDSIVNLLSSKHPVEQFLSALIIEETKPKLSKKQKENLDKVYKSENTADYCAGCTEWDTVELRVLLDKNKLNYIKKEGLQWIARLKKTNTNNN